MEYDWISGDFRWRIRRWGRVEVGGLAGYPGGRGGRIVITVDGNEYFASRLAWLHFYGEWPEGQVDHKDRNVTNNAILNLRDATHGQNRANSRLITETVNGLKGVRTFRNSKRFYAYITIDKKNRYIGSYETAEEAHKAYLAEAVKAKGEFAYSGF